MVSSSRSRRFKNQSKLEFLKLNVSSGSWSMFLCSQSGTEFENERIFISYKERFTLILQLIMLADGMGSTH
jgi:hypothetical protein